MAHGAEQLLNEGVYLIWMDVELLVGGVVLILALTISFPVVLFLVKQILGFSDPSSGSRASLRQADGMRSEYLVTKGHGFGVVLGVGGSRWVGLSSKLTLLAVSLSRWGGYPRLRKQFERSSLFSSNVLLSEEALRILMNSPFMIPRNVDRG